MDVEVEVERFGKKTELVRSCSLAMHPIIGYIVEDEQGWLALPKNARVPPNTERSRHDAIDYVRRNA